MNTPLPYQNKGQHHAAPPPPPAFSLEEIAPQTQDTTVHHTISTMANFASLLRIGGALAVIAAMSLFLMQDWAEGNDISRYYMLLSQTLLLAGGGFCMSYLMKENKSARVFFGLGLISITVNMATLGALVFSMTQWGSDLVSYPGFAKWQAMDGFSLMSALGATLLVSAPVAIFSHMVLARRSTKMLVALSLLTNLLLLLPVRESIWLGIVAATAILLPLWFISKAIHHNQSLKSPEGMFAIATIFAPAGIIIVRSLMFYEIDALLLGTLSSIVFIGIRFCMPHLEDFPNARRILNVISGLAAVGVAAPMATSLFSFRAESITLFSMILAALLLDVANRSHSTKMIVGFTGWMLAVLNIIPALWGDMYSAPLCVMVGVGVILLGRHYGLRHLLVAGIALIVTTIVSQFYSLLYNIDFTSWSTLAVLGVIAIVGAATIERHGAVIKLKWQKAFE